MVLMLVVFGFICWYCSNWENRFSIRLMGGLGSIQSSPRRNVEDAKGRVQFWFLDRVLPLSFVLLDWGFPLVWFVQGVWVLPQHFQNLIFQILM